MTGLTRSFDSDTWRWTFSVGPSGSVGPAGTASVWLTDGVRVDADAWNGSLLGMIVDVDRADGRLSPEIERVVGALIDSDDRWRSDAAGPLSRLARVVDAGARASAMGGRAQAYDDEAAELRTVLGLRRASADGAPAGVAPDVPEAIAVDVALEQLRRRAGDLGALGGVGAGGPRASWRVLLDPSTVPAGILELGGGVGVRRSEDGQRLRVEVPLIPDIYAVEAQRITCVVVDRATDLPVAVQRLDVGAGAGNLAAGVAELVVSPARSLDDLDLVFTDRPDRLPSSALRAARAASHLAALGASAARLGDRTLATSLLERSVARWESIGRGVPDPGVPVDEPPFAGELVATFPLA